MHFNVQLILMLARGAAILDFELGTLLQVEVVSGCSGLRIWLASVDVGKMFPFLWPIQISHGANRLPVTKHVQKKQN